MYSDQDIGELRARVKNLEAKLDFLYKHLNLPYQTEIIQEDEPVINALRAGNVLEAIRAYRELYGVDPVSARQAVEEFKVRLGLG
jgi:hypothetical protein